MLLHVRGRRGFSVEDTHRYNAQPYRCNRATLAFIAPQCLVYNRRGRARLNLLILLLHHLHSSLSLNLFTNLNLLSEMNSITVLAFAALLALSQALIPSAGSMTNAMARGGLNDSDFFIRPSLSGTLEAPNGDFTVSLATPSIFPALGGNDVQMTAAVVTIKAGRPLITHSHPHAVEMLSCVHGRVNVSFQFEGLNGRVIANTLSPGQFTVFPQGLVHRTSCVSKFNCLLYTSFNSADPGLVPVIE